MVHAAAVEVTHAELDVRAGGGSFIVMRGPEGEEMPSRGIYLEVVPNEKLVFTDAYVRAWEPAAKPFMTGILYLRGSRRRPHALYCAGSAFFDRGPQTHEAMGFHAGWGQGHGPAGGTGALALSTLLR